MALLVELYDLKAVVKGLTHDLGIANDNLQYVKNENERLSEVIKVLKTKVRVAPTVGSAQKKDNVLGGTLAPILSVSDVVMVPMTVQPVDVVEDGETKEIVFEHMDVDTGSNMDIYEIRAMSYKLKWHTPDCKSRGIWIYCESDEHLIVEGDRIILL